MRGLTIAWILAIAGAGIATSDANAQTERRRVFKRRIVLCLDGTWNGTSDRTPSNVVKIARAVVPIDPENGVQQITYYDLGVGALAEYPGRSNQLLHVVDRFLGGAFGAGFEGNVEDALHFLVLNYHEGDEVFIFGFSRGAATARAVTAFLEWNGGLPEKEDAYYLPRLFRAFVVAHGARDAAAAEIERIKGERPSRPQVLRPFRRVPIKYLGVWDTVMALGSRFRARGSSTSVAPRSFYAGTVPAEGVQNARQALAIDETRSDFRPEIWIGKHDHQTMKQRWFAGVHSNVGGGYDNDGLANVALKWILEGAMELGLKLDSGYLRYFASFHQDTLYRSATLSYRFADRVRWRIGRGRRSLVGLPPGANIEIDRSVFARMSAQPAHLHGAKNGGKQRTYRPENVLLFLASLPDVDTYVQSVGYTGPIPDDVRKRIEELRPDATRMMAELSPSPSRP